MIHLVIGGARSGKSSFAEQQVLKHAQQLQLKPSYIATATAGDSEMSMRIAQHQQQRDMKHWQLHECPLGLTKLLAELDDCHFYLLDCLTLWLTNVLMAAFKRYSIGEEYGEQDQCDEQEKQANKAIAVEIEQHVDELIQVLSKSKIKLVIVTNEVGQGIVPLGALSRLFVDHAGWLNQKVAAVADKVTLVTAGLPLVLKSDGLNVENIGNDCD